ncbi:unnamed protein product [Clavelina lepadiformis]|uniref:Ubiquitinyl hydrolase 1 n=1 Tax=Clavelina lepadiformis TaxID=159417 RepID=A0ABP0GLQ1_CLALP
MEAGDVDNCKYVNILGKKLRVIQCTLNCMTQEAAVVTPSTNSQAQEENDDMDDASKEAFLRQMSTTNEPDVDIYTASGSNSNTVPSNNKKTPQQNNENLSQENRNREEEVDSGNEEGPEDANEGVDGVSSSTNEAITSEEELEATDVEDAVNLALTIDEDLPQFVFDYEVETEEFNSGPQEVMGAALSVPDSNNLSEATAANPKENTMHEPAEAEEENTTRPDDMALAPAPSQDETVGQSFPSELDQMPTDALVSLSSKLDILAYAKSEWKGTTFTAKCLRRGYKQLVKETGCRYMRQVRGDNYCALRATAFQILSQNVDILNSYPNWDRELLDLPETLQKMYKCSWLKQWTFAGRLPSNDNNRFQVMHDCLSFLVEQKKLSAAMAKEDDRQAHFSALFNSGSVAEIKLFEALKLLMLKAALELHTANESGKEVPVFAWLLFARDTSEDPKNLMLNHLNPAGKTGGLEQVEMCLLGQALEVTIRVIRPSNVNQEDFITHYPDHMIDRWQKIDLIAEDDRHYNLTVK